MTGRIVSLARLPSDAAAFDHYIRHLPVPGLERLSDYAVPGHAPVLFGYERAGELIAIFPFIPKTVRLFGRRWRVLFAYCADYYDYCGIYAKTPLALKPVLRQLRRAVAGTGGYDGVMWPSLLLDPNDDAGTAQLRSLSAVSYTTRYYDCAGASDFSELTGKKSVRRHANKAQRNGFFTELTEGALTDTQADFIAETSLERWRAAGVRCAFENPERRGLITRYPGDKMWLRLTDGDDWLAYLYGQRVGGTLMWYTPTVNRAHMDHSPLEVLLDAVCRYCEARGITALDFGIGDERYKERFSNRERPVWHLVLPTHPVLRLLVRLPYRLIRRLRKGNR